MNSLPVNTNELVIRGIRISNIGYHGLISVIKRSILDGQQTAIAYANANSINSLYKFPELREWLNEFDIIHPDGSGIRIAATILNKPLTESGKFTGSDLYPLLINEAIINKFTFYFFGHDSGTLGRIAEKNPELIVKGTHKGYDFRDEEVISDINKDPADILIVGLGTPKQERWTAAYRDKIKCKVILCVGEGIKVFAGSKKRGPVFLRTLGLEWLWRFLGDPVKYFRRYIIGNPLFLYRIISIKMRKLAG